MKSFVFNFMSGDLDKFKSGEDLFNLVATCLAFDQKVIVIAHQFNEETFFEGLSGDKNFILLKFSSAKNLIKKSDFYLEC